MANYKNPAFPARRSANVEPAHCIRVCKASFRYSGVFGLTQPTIYNPAFVTMEGGLPQAEAALIAGIEGEQPLQRWVPVICVVIGRAGTAGMLIQI
jgi:hypothetical protein